MTARDLAPGERAWPCPTCNAATGEPCRDRETGEPLTLFGCRAIHGTRITPMFAPTGEGNV